MSNGNGPGAGGIVAGIFLILFGLCLTVLGGGCTLLWISMLSSMGGGGSGSGIYEAMPLIALALVTLGAGIALVWLGVKLMTGGFNK
jgi:hypothetical protein